MTDIFEIASRRKYRFPSAIGELTVEQLWDLPLTDPKRGATLDNVAKADRADKRRKLIEALANKQDDAIRNLSEDEIRAKLAELDDAA